MSESSLESLISHHRSTLTDLYTLISSEPNPIVAKELESLSHLLTSTIQAQRSKAEQEKAQYETTLSEQWKKVEEWRSALGETSSATTTMMKQNDEATTTPPLLESIQQVEQVLQSMRGRMEQRGKQILQLNRTLSSFIPILGRDWFAIELDPVAAQDDQNEAAWEGLDLRLERMSALEREVMRCDTELAQRRDVLNANVNEIFALRSELGIHQGDGATPDELDEAILAHLGVGEARERKELSPTTETLARIEAKRKWLEEEKDQRNLTIQTTYDKLYPLWTMLGVSEFEMEQFVNNHMGSTQDVVTAYQDELARMLTLKRSNLSAFIQRERQALSNLWDALYLSGPQRLHSFPPYAICVDSTRTWNEQTGAEEEVINHNVSEELLIAHERERERLELEVERCQPVLERLAKYFSVVNEMRDLEASASDPSRLLGKSTRGDPGRLLREEKARKRVVKEKPKLEAELRQFIPMWEQENQRAFLVNGVRFLDDLENQMEAEMAEKEMKKREKLGSKAATTTTKPLQPQMTGRSTTSTRPLQAQMTGASSNGPNAIAAPIKRQMTGRSVTGGSNGPPTAKRQTPMITGGRTATTATAPKPIPLGDHNGQHQHYATQQHPIATKLAPQATGMRLPSGWGNPATTTTTTTGQQEVPNGMSGYALQQQQIAPPTQSFYVPTAVPLRAQPTGGFRPGPRA